MIKNELCVVIPAAGCGSRLGEKTPKILLPIVKEQTVWNILYDKLRLVADHIHVVLSNQGTILFEKQLAKDGNFSEVSFSIQKKPIGMGDAIFGASDYWDGYKNILVIWGDQVFVSNETLKKTKEAQASFKTAGLTLPITVVRKPYVEYIFNDDFSNLKTVKQTREGDKCRENSFADVGVFCLSTSGLMQAWKKFLKNVVTGNKTGEINFLPFLPYLSTRMRWAIKTVLVKDNLEARGINTRQDMAFFKKKFEALLM